jgi:hypothetical protein
MCVSISVPGVLVIALFSLKETTGLWSTLTCLVSTLRNVRAGNFGPLEDRKLTFLRSQSL